eukprot:scaffold1938_cov399-Prasinococcus_capsulatus_cf.AAC.19
MLLALVASICGALGRKRSDEQLTNVTTHLSRARRMSIPQGPGPAYVSTARHASGVLRRVLRRLLRSASPPQPRAARASAEAGQPTDLRVTADMIRIRGQRA